MQAFPPHASWHTFFGALPSQEQFPSVGFGVGAGVTGAGVTGAGVVTGGGVTGAIVGIIQVHGAISVGWGVVGKLVGLFVGCRYYI